MEQQQSPEEFKPKKMRHKMYGTKTATTHVEYEAAKTEGWEDDEPQAQKSPTGGKPPGQ